MGLDPISSSIGMGLGLIGGVANIIGAGKANRRLDALYKQNPTYKTSEFAQQRLGLAQTLLNGRMPGASNVERNIYGSQANATANINRNATDASQALSLAAGVQGQTNASFDQLGMQESQDYYNRLQNVTGAQEGMINEGDKMHNDQVRRYNDLAAIRGAQSQNTSNAWSSLSNLGFGMANFGMSGGFGSGSSGGSGNAGGGRVAPYTRQWNTGYQMPSINMPG